MQIPPIVEKQEKAQRGELSVTEMKELIEIMKLRKELEKITADEYKPNQHKTGRPGFRG